MFLIKIQLNTYKVHLVGTLLDACLVLGWTPICLHSNLTTSRHGFSKVLETSLLDFCPWWCVCTCSHPLGCKESSSYLLSSCLYSSLVWDGNWTCFCMHYVLSWSCCSEEQAVSLNKKVYLVKWLYVIYGFSIVILCKCLFILTMVIDFGNTGCIFLNNVGLWILDLSYKPSGPTGWFGMTPVARWTNWLSLLISECDPLMVMVACGPYTPSDSLSYDPLIDLISIIVRDQPDMCILVSILWVEDCSKCMHPFCAS